MRLVRSRLGAGLFVFATAAAATFVVAACATGTDGGVALDGDGGLDDAAQRDVNVLPAKDSSTGSDTGAPGDDAGSCTKNVVINELKTDGTNLNDEMIELYNPSSCAVPLGNWELKYQSGGGGTGPAGHKFATGDSIAANSYLVVAPVGAPKSDAPLTTGMAKDNGQIGLLDESGTLVDAVAYGAVTAGSYREGQSAPTPPTSGSIGRSPNGADTNNNKTDFTTFPTPSTGVAN